MPTPPSLSDVHTHSPAQVLRQLLVDLGYGSDPPLSGIAPSWAIYATNEPPDPDETICIVDTIGLNGGRLANGEIAAPRPGVQVRVRSREHIAGWQRAYAIQQALALEIYQKVVHLGTANYLVWAIVNIGNILPSREPDSNRRIFTINPLMVLKPI